MAFFLLFFCSWDSERNVSAVMDCNKPFYPSTRCSVVLFMCIYSLFNGVFNSSRYMHKVLKLFMNDELHNVTTVEFWVLINHSFVRHTDVSEEHASSAIMIKGSGQNLIISWSGCSVSVKYESKNSIFEKKTASSKERSVSTYKPSRYKNPECHSMNNSRRKSPIFETVQNAEDSGWCLIWDIIAAFLLSYLGKSRKQGKG
jgi:hypothetical protein